MAEMSPRPLFRPELIEPRLFVRFWFSSFKKYKMKANGIFIDDPKDIFGTIWLDYESLHAGEVAKVGAFDPASGKKVPIPKINEKNLEKAWVEFLNEATKEASAHIFAAVKFNPAATSNMLEEWMTATFGTYTPFQVAALKHTIWQVKRKMFRLKVVHHLSPCFWGLQGGGKSEAIKKLCEPLMDLTVEWGVAEALDPRSTPTLAKNYVCLFDEMAGLARVDLEVLKRTITADFTNYRPMRTNDQIKVKQNCTFFGISNKSLTENIYDPTGLRRFVEFKCLPTLNWARINAVNSLDIWKSVDENLDRGYIEGFASELKSHQESMMVQDELQDFVNDLNIIGKMESTREILIQELYDRYFAWRLQNGYGSKPAPPKHYFAAKIRSHGLEKRMVTIAGKDKVAYTVNAESDLFKNPEGITTISRKVLEFKK